MNDKIDWIGLLPKQGGEMGQRVIDFDWSATPIGPLASWPHSLRIALAMVLASPVPQMMSVGPAGVMIYNDAYSIVAGGRHPGLLGQPLLEGWPEVADFNRHVLEVCLAGGALSFGDQHLVLYRNGGPEDVWLDLSYSPIPGDDGEPAGVLAIVVETTKRIHAEQELAKNRERLSFALNSAGMVGTWDWHIGSNLFFPDARLAQLFSTDAQRAEQGIPVEEYLAAIHPDDLPRIREAFATAIRDKDKYSEEYRLLGRDGSHHWVIARGECLYDHEGRPVRFPGAIVDITELKESEEARTTLLHELNHRVKNIFAVVSGLVSMTARTTATPRDMAEALRGRLSALAAAHDLIKSAVWGESQEEEKTHLADLLDRILAPHLGRPDQVLVEGPRVELGATAATSLALVFHELATNAAKYGALAEEDGRIEVRWTASAGDIDLLWSERRPGGASTDTPAHRGFGSQLIEMSVQRQLKGQMSYEWSPIGLQVALQTPIAQLSR